MTAKEIWRPVPSYEGLQASSWGRIKLPDREAPMPRGGVRKYTPSPTYGYKTKSNKTGKRVYMNVCNKFFGNIKVHRAVCEAFHGPPPFEGAEVMHLNEDATDNRPENLRWGTRKENLNFPGFIEYCRTRPHPRLKAKSRVAE